MSRKSSCQEPCASTVIFTEQVLDQIAEALGMADLIPPAINFIPTSVWQPDFVPIIGSGDASRVKKQYPTIASARQHRIGVPTLQSKTLDSPESDKSDVIDKQQSVDPIVAEPDQKANGCSMSENVKSEVVNNAVSSVTAQKLKSKAPHSARRVRKNAPGIASSSSVPDQYLSFGETNYQQTTYPSVTYNGPTTATYIITGQLTLVTAAPPGYQSADSYDRSFIQLFPAAMPDTPFLTTVEISIFLSGTAFGVAEGQTTSFLTTVPFNDTIEIAPGTTLILGQGQPAEVPATITSVLGNDDSDNYDGGNVTQITFQRVSPLP